VHPRLSVSGLCFHSLPPDQMLAALGDAGARHASLFVPHLRMAGWAQSLDRIVSSGITVTALAESPGVRSVRPATWAGTQSRPMETIDAAASLGAVTVYTLTGQRSGPGWDEAAAAYADAVQPVVAFARSAGVRLAVEPTAPATQTCPSSTLSVTRWTWRGGARRTSAWTSTMSGPRPARSRPWAGCPTGSHWCRKATTS
jgi:sugar phosphate isomerase/epimerase